MTSNETDPLISPDRQEEENIQNPPNVATTSAIERKEVKVYKTRWYILFMFSAMNVVQGYLCNIWSVTANSSEAAFGWKDSDISLMLNWLYITYLVGIIPFSWLTNAKGLRVSVLLAAGLVLFGALVRVITFQAPTVTWLANIGHIADGFAGPVCFAGGLVVSGTWFPPHERAMATAFATIMGFIGDALCYIIGPLMITEPTSSNTTCAEKEHIIFDIKRLRYIECGMCGLVFIVLVVYFPTRPPSAPSITASKANMPFRKAIRELFRYKNISFWLVASSYGLAGGVSGVWFSLLDVNLKAIGETQTIAGWFGFYATITGSFFAIFIGWVADRIQGKMKPLALMLVTVYTLSGFWIVLLVNNYITYDRRQMYAACILSGLCSNGVVPLIFELATELCYPVPATVASGVITVLHNVHPPIFLLLFTIPNIGTSWMNWCQYIAVLISFPLVLFAKEDYRRFDIDTQTHHIDTETDSNTDTKIQQPEPVTQTSTNSSNKELPNEYMDN